MRTGDGGSLAASSANARVVYHVSVGGADVRESLGLPTGCDANFSLTARVDADGTARGQWQDTFSGGGSGQHSAIDCVNIQGTTAVIGGVVTRRTDGEGNDLTGFRSLTAVVDNGTSRQDRADQIGPTLLELRAPASLPAPTAPTIRWRTSKRQVFCKT